MVVPPCFAPAPSPSALCGRGGCGRGRGWRLPNSHYVASPPVAHGGGGSRCSRAAYAARPRGLRRYASRCSRRGCWLPPATPAAPPSRRSLRSRRARGGRASQQPHPTTPFCRSSPSVKTAAQQLFNVLPLSVTGEKFTISPPNRWEPAVSTYPLLRYFII